MRSSEVPSVRALQHESTRQISQANLLCDSRKPRRFLRCVAAVVGVCVMVMDSRAAFYSDVPGESTASSAPMTQSPGSPVKHKRPVTVADSIEMTRLGDPSYAAGESSKGIVARFSPDGKCFVVVLRKGHLSNNTNEYTLFLFETSQVFESPQPRRLLSMASSSNRPAIHNVVWLNDDDTIFFLGEQPGETTSLYSFRSSSNELKKLTNHATSLTAFLVSSDGSEIVYTAETPPENVISEVSSRNGVRVTREPLAELIGGAVGGGEYGDHDIFIQQVGVGDKIKVQLKGRIGYPFPVMSLAPDGKHLVVQTEALHIPATWTEYENRLLQIYTQQKIDPGAPSNVYQYEMVDLHNGQSQLLVDAPFDSISGSEMAWAPDSRSVVVSNMYLPLTTRDPAERALRKGHSFLAEFKISSQQASVISNEDLRLIRWDDKTNSLICDVGRLDSLNGKSTPKAYFRKNGESWTRVRAFQEMASPLLPDIVLDEGMNTPPRIFATDAAHNRRSLLMDLNPQFGDDLVFAKVEEVMWKNSFGDKLKGGLYWPIDYVEGKKYPFVIQTHGWVGDRFWIDGPYTTAFAAQALAGRGFFVLQTPDPDWHIFATPKEGPHVMATYESAIDYMDRRGLIDRSSVGIIGFSRTVWYTMYTLTHSNHGFAAAAIADSSDAGYFPYLAFANSNPAAIAQVDSQAGGPPFGKTLRRWLKDSPSFLLDRIRTPLRIQVMGPSALLEAWHLYTGPFRLGKPVELIYIPEGTHILEKPWERLISQQGNLEWFCFWLKGEEDPDPAKAAQYERWRELRKVQEENEKKLQIVH